MGTSSPFLCLDPLPLHPSTLHSRDLISPTAWCHNTRRNRWLLSNFSAVHATACIFYDSRMVTAVRHPLRSPGVWVLKVTEKNVMDQQLQSSPLQPVQPAVRSGLRDGWVKAWSADDPKCVICIKTLVPSGFPPAVPHPPALVRNCCCMGRPIQHKQITVKIQTRNGDISWQFCNVSVWPSILR